MEKKSYYERINEIIIMLDEAYDNIGSLRDAADTHEKQVYNDSREVLGALASRWRQFRDQVPQRRAEMLL